MIKKFTSTLEIDPKNGTVVKKSTNIKLIENQFAWFSNIVKLNPAFSKMIPAFSNFSKSTRSAKYEMEYIPAKSLAKIFIDDNLDLENWKIILKNILKGLKYFQKFPAIRYDNLSSKKELYLTKTQETINEIRESTFFKNTLKYASINVNDVSCSNFIFLEQKIISEIKKKFLLTPDKAILAHGNLVLDNILFESVEYLKMINPLGFYHKQTIYGPQIYDFAKLSSSIRSKIDFIFHDKFIVKQNGSNFELNFNIANLDKFLKIEKFL
ncbi:hypothetical protein NV226_02995 [Mycoplasma iguanae]|uniref:Aminoglycoside phosphotransferase domain-containing protein n=1 Tax=Mycoplasma iguanae TaxID=292461 RepID=A0ABY5R827_9MOLU|nr:hypothetical protein [Mycoplasma iguanae]UVD81666.1 hypothetical protein NV226_02995 [Mycoplasma iguanae]